MRSVAPRYSARSAFDRLPEKVLHDSTPSACMCATFSLPLCGTVVRTCVLLLCRRTLVEQYMCICKVSGCATGCAVVYMRNRTCSGRTGVESVVHDRTRSYVTYALIRRARRRHDGA